MADGSSLAVSAAALQREESFRTALRNQKRRLSATERKPSVPDLGISKVQLLLLSREPNPKASVQCNLDETFTQERAGLLVKRDSLTPPRKGLLNQCSVEDEEVVAVVTVTKD